MSSLWQDLKWLIIGLVVGALGVIVSCFLLTYPVIGAVLSGAITFTIWSVAYRNNPDWFTNDSVHIGFGLRILSVALLLLLAWGAYSTISFLAYDDSWNVVSVTTMSFNPFPYFYKLVFWVSIYGITDIFVCNSFLRPRSLKTYAR